MSRNLDSVLATQLGEPSILPVVMATFTLGSGPMYVWSGVGDLLYNGNTYKGIGNLGKLSAIQESSEVRADGMEVSLSGIGASPFEANNQIPAGITTPPVDTTLYGNTFAWAFATETGTSADNPGTCGGSGSNYSGGVQCGDGVPGTTGVSMLWTGFKAPVLPDGAVVTAIVPVAIATNTTGSSGTQTGAIHGPGTLPLPAGGPYVSFLAQGVSIGTDLAAMYTQEFTLFSGNSVSQGGGNEVVQFDFMGFAVFYQTPQTNTSLIYEAENDIIVGAPASIYFGLWNEDTGELFGVPYLIFEGMVDQPTTDIGTATSTLSLALENRLSNMQRPSGRRWTSADQRLKYPDDTGFQFVEMLNDIALKWG